MRIAKKQIQKEARLEREKTKHKYYKFPLGMRDAAQTSLLLQGIDSNFRNLKDFTEKLSLLLCNQFVQRSRMTALLANLAPQLTTVLANQLGMHSSQMGELAIIKQCTPMGSIEVICDSKLTKQGKKCSKFLLVTLNNVLFQVEPITHVLQQINPDEITYVECKMNKILYKTAHNPLDPIRTPMMEDKTYLYYTEKGCRFHTVPAKSLQLRINNHLEEPKVDVERLSELLQHGIDRDIGYQHSKLQQALQAMEQNQGQYKDLVKVAEQQGIMPALSPLKKFFHHWYYHPGKTLYIILQNICLSLVVILICFFIFHYLQQKRKQQKEQLPVVETESISPNEAIEYKEIDSTDNPPEPEEERQPPLIIIQQR